MVFHHIPCLTCYFCRKKTFAQCPVYKRVGCTAGFEPSGGGFAEYVRVMDWIVERGLVKIPDDVPFEQAAFVEPLNTCLKGVRSLNLAADETVLVIGQGPIGILLASLAKRSGATVLTADLYPERHKVAALFGLDRPIDASREEIAAAARSASEGRGADAVLVAAAGNALIRTAMDAARPGGKVLLFAQTQHGEAAIDPAAVCVDEKALLGSYSASADLQEESARLAFDGYARGYDLTQLISHRFPLEQAVAAIQLASQPSANSMKIVIQPGTASPVARE
jgi:L-iditol 2-dehydrogenase